MEIDTYYFREYITKFDTYTALKTFLQHHPKPTFKHDLMPIKICLDFKQINFIIEPFQFFVARGAREDLGSRVMAAG